MRSIFINQKKRFLMRLREGIVAPGGKCRLPALCQASIGELTTGRLAQHWPRPSGMDTNKEWTLSALDMNVGETCVSSQGSQGWGRRTAGTGGPQGAVSIARDQGKTNHLQHLTVIHPSSLPSLLWVFVDQILTMCWVLGVSSPNTSEALGPRELGTPQGDAIFVHI